MAEELSWSAPEFKHYPKSPRWFAGLFIVGIGFAVYFLVRKDFLASILFILLLVIIFYFSRSKPKTINIRLTDKGVYLSETHLPYHQIKVFWIVHESDIKILNFETTAYLNRFFTIQLEEQDPVPVREFLLKYLPEDPERQESLSDKIARKLKF